MLEVGYHLNRGSELFSLNSSELTTHAVCFGMTGSGKTGLMIRLIEEVILSGRSAILIDPKGDLANLCYPFKTVEEFACATDPSQAESRKLSVDEYAEVVHRQWTEGRKADDLEWKLNVYRNNVDITIYTPGSMVGVPLSILKSFARPPQQIMDSSEALLDRGGVLANSLLGLLPPRWMKLDRERVLLENVFQYAWANGEDLSMSGLIDYVVNPPMVRLGAQTVESFMPKPDRLKFARALNAVVAAPKFDLWQVGEPLDLEVMYNPTETGKPKISIMSIAHLPEQERHFFVALLLNEAIAWMRQQSGASDLRALLYMDEVAGYLPPNRMPATKLPMLTLLKQARAFGLGIVLASQNPIDVDYKALGNCGTWFVGRLTTKRDKERLLDGMADSDHFASTKSEVRSLIGKLKPRQFLVNSMYHGLSMIRSRHTICYLSGPVPRERIQVLMGTSDDPETLREARLRRLGERLCQLEVAIDEQHREIDEIKRRLVKHGGLDLGTVVGALIGGRFMRARAVQKALQSGKNPKTAAMLEDAQTRLERMADELKRTKREIEVIA